MKSKYTRNYLIYHIRIQIGIYNRLETASTIEIDLL